MITEKITFVFMESIRIRRANHIIHNIIYDLVLRKLNSLRPNHCFDFLRLYQNSETTSNFYNSRDSITRRNLKYFFCFKKLDEF